MTSGGCPFRMVGAATTELPVPTASHTEVGMAASAATSAGFAGKATGAWLLGDVGLELPPVRLTATITMTTTTTIPMTPAMYAPVGIRRSRPREAGGRGRLAPAAVPGARAPNFWFWTPDAVPSATRPLPPDARRKSARPEVRAVPPWRLAPPREEPPLALLMGFVAPRPVPPPGAGPRPGTSGPGGSRNRRDRLPRRSRLLRHCAGRRAPARPGWRGTNRGRVAEDRRHTSRTPARRPRRSGSLLPARSQRCVPRAEARDAHRTRRGVTTALCGIRGPRHCGPSGTRRAHRSPTPGSLATPRAQSSSRQGYRWRHR